MTQITLKNLDPKLTQHLQQRAQQNGRTLEAEITAILASVLNSSAPTEPNLAIAIQQRFAEVGGVEFPEIPRESVRNPPTF
jgi:plasmid stability protein